jgi:uncharacterized protein YciI
MAAHWAYELSIKHRILAAGSLRSDNGLTPTGSLLLVKAASRDAAMALIQADPATAAGLRGSITIRCWNAACQSARKPDPLSASNFDPSVRRRDQGLSRRSVHVVEAGQALIGVRRGV